MDLDNSDFAAQNTWFGDNVHLSVHMHHLQSYSTDFDET